VTDDWLNTTLIGFTIATGRDEPQPIHASITTEIEETAIILEILLVFVENGTFVSMAYCLRRVAKPGSKTVGQPRPVDLVVVSLHAKRGCRAGLNQKAGGRMSLSSTMHHSKGTKAFRQLDQGAVSARAKRSRPRTSHKPTPE
jgi:hypothetical protein